MISGGRWNSIGTPMIYLASSVSLSMLEIRVNSRAPRPRERIVHKLDIPTRWIKTPEDIGYALPDRWAATPSLGGPAQSFGDNWIEGMASVALKVPSAVVPMEFNILVNPAHRLFDPDKVSVESEEIYLTARLWDVMVSEETDS